MVLARPILILLLLLAACERRDLETGQSLELLQARPGRFATWTDAVPPYRLGPGDKLKVKFLVTREMDEDATIGPDGNIGLRSTGQIKAEGQSIQELQDAVIAASRRVVTPQDVVISLEDSASSRIYVGGSVRAPGAYRIAERRINVLQAILVAGGFAGDARFDEVGLIRRGEDGLPMLRTINVRQLIQTGTDNSDVPLVAGDILYVPRSSIAELGLWVEQFITRVLPFDRHFNYTIGRITDK